MSEYRIAKNDELMHYGVKGMRWHKHKKKFDLRRALDPVRVHTEKLGKTGLRVPTGVAVRDNYGGTYTLGPHGNKASNELAIEPFASLNDYLRGVKVKGLVGSASKTPQWLQKKRSTPLSQVKKAVSSVKRFLGGLF